MKISNSSSTAHHHQILGTIKRSRRTFHEYVRSYISVELIGIYELVFGRLPRKLTDLNNLDKTEPIYNMDNYY